jgi:hypothetical protein
MEIRKTAAGCALAVPVMTVSLLMAAPSALADPAMPPAPPPAPGAAPQAPPPGATPQAATSDTAAPPDGMPHLSSPQNPPPGTSTDPDDADDSPGMSYLRELWQAVHSQDISKRQALLLLTQRPMNPDSTPPPGVAAGPQPSGPADAPPGPAGPPPPAPPSP